MPNKSRLQVCALHIGEAGDQQNMLRYVSEDKRKRIASFHRAQEARQALWGELMVRAMACRQLGLKNRDIEFAYNPWGKPALRHTADFCFNLSHSGDWVVGAFAAWEVGIDVQQVEAIDPQLASYTLTPAEYHALMQQPDQARNEAFFAIWTLKESYLKLLGRGLSVPLASVAIRKERDGSYGLDPSGVEERVYFRPYDLAPGYKLSVCARENNFPDGVSILTSDRVLAALNPF